MTNRNSRDARTRPARAAAAAAATAAILLLGACGQSATTGNEGAVAGTVAELPLKRGFYVGADTACDTASNATLVLVRRAGINWSRNACDLHSIEQTGPGSYRATQSCLDLEGNPAESSTVIFEIADDSRFGYGTADSDYRVEYRHCEQSALPEPWRENDISDLVQ